MAEEQQLVVVYPCGCTFIGSPSEVRRWRRDHDEGQRMRRLHDRLRENFVWN